MQLEQQKWTAAEGWSPSPPGGLGDRAQLVLAFAASPVMRDPGVLGELSGAYPKAHLLVCSTAGEICDTRVSDDSVVATALAFERTRVEAVALPRSENQDSYEAGKRVAERLAGDDLVHVLVFSDGTSVNGTRLVSGLVDHLPDSITITGGLAGDGERFEQTFVFLGPEPRQEMVVGVGFYGTHLRIGHGSLGGWDPFGPERLITRSDENVLYELDGRSALELYKQYLGEYASDLPASALLFPLAVRAAGEDRAVVRTVLAIDEEKQTMTFAGDLLEGQYARLMKANFERLIDGATAAARATVALTQGDSPEFALLISCVGRKMVLRQRIEEEVESVREIFGGRTVLAGFYSYGELSPATPASPCELHNQTMTITTLSEI